jgi:hypothetical protein
MSRFHDGDGKVDAFERRVDIANFESDSALTRFLSHDGSLIEASATGTRRGIKFICLFFYHRSISGSAERDLATAIR